MSNPFNDPEANPFDDDAIGHALSGSGSGGYHQLHSPTTLGGLEAVRLSTEGGSSKAPPLAAAQNQALGGGGDWSAREAEMRRREEELAARERQVQQQEEALRAHGLHPPNWPPFYPLIYHDIDSEVPATSRPTVHKIYRYWLASIGVLALNMVACLTILASHSTTTGGTDFGGALIYTFTITALSFFAWYRPAYTAFTKDSSLFFYIFLLFEGLHVLFAAYMAVGLPGSGSGGIINLLSVLTDGKYISAAFCVAATAGWVFDAVLGSWVWVEVNTHVKRGGHSLDSARAQAVSMGVLGGSAVVGGGARV